MKLFTFLILFLTLSLNVFGTGQNKEAKLTIYFKTTECTKGYMSLHSINTIAKMIDVEMVVDSSDIYTVEQIWQTYGVDSSLIDWRVYTREEMELYADPWSTYVFNYISYTFIGQYPLLITISQNLSSFLDMNKPQAKLYLREPGVVGIFPPFSISDTTAVISSEIAGMIYIAHPSSESQDIKSKEYFSADSTFYIYQVVDSFKKVFYDLTNEPGRPPAIVESVIHYKQQPLLFGYFTFAVTPLFHTNRRNFLIYFDGKVVSHSTYNIIDDNKRLSPALYSGVSIDTNEANFSSFCVFVWQRKKHQDSLFIGRYEYSKDDTTWYQKEIFLLDANIENFDYSTNVQAISKDFAIHSNLPFLYSFKDSIKYDLSPILSNIFKRQISSKSPMPEGYNIINVWNNDTLVRLFCGAPNGQIYSLTFWPEINVFRYYSLNDIGLPNYKKIRNLSFDPQGIPTLLYQEGRYFELYKVRMSRD